MRASAQIEMHNKWLKYFREMRMKMITMQKIGAVSSSIIISL